MTMRVTRLALDKVFENEMEAYKEQIWQATESYHPTDQKMTAVKIKCPAPECNV